MIQVEVKDVSKDEIKKGDYAISMEDRIVFVTLIDKEKDILEGYFVHGDGYTFGYFTKKWCLKEFRKFYGTITIKCD